MSVRVKRLLVCLGVVVCSALPGMEQQRANASQTRATQESLKTNVDSLKSANVVWRKITWKSCLLEGLKESRATGKPVFLWIFIDRPADDARC